MDTLGRTTPAVPHPGSRAAALALTAVLTGLTSAATAQELGDEWGTARAESAFYELVELPIPRSLHLEASSMCMLPDGRLAVGTRRGEILLFDGLFEPVPRDVRWTRFAEGLDEVFGIGVVDDGFVVTQQTEVTRVTDEDGDGRADRFRTLSDAWGFEHYHEFSWGSAPDENGDVWVVLGLSNSYHYRADFRGWAFRVSPDGTSIPVASGIRSAGGVAPNEHGVMFYVESQGPWNGSCSLKHLKPGGFMGHPVSYAGYEKAAELGLDAVVGTRPEEPRPRSRLIEESDRIEELLPYAVVFPYRRMGQSISGFRVDHTGGRFGPFADQLFVADYSLSLVMRATTELVDGVWQGACYPFREGLGTGILTIEFSPEGYLVAGGTNRGWPVRGRKSFVLERLQWTGRVPFEIERISIRPGGFAVRFTEALDPARASDPGNWPLATFTHIYRQGYGSPEVDQTEPTVTRVELSDDHRTARLHVDGMVRGHVHTFDVAALRNADSAEPLHRHAYYTVNRIPDAEK